VAAVMLFVSLADYGYQKWQHRKDLMMTKQEIKEEYKESEGNPQIKSRIRSIQKSLARQRMLSQVHKATMVITNPTHYAVAMTYSPEMDAPTVVAKGVDFLARRIIKIARRQGIPVIQNPPLARALYKQVRLDETIPATLYRAVAKVLAYVFQQKRQSAK
jgi:flagellar biosynthetic protein FlhB